MKFNQDYIPSNIEAAVIEIVGSLEKEEIDKIKTIPCKVFRSTIIDSFGLFFVWLF